MSHANFDPVIQRRLMRALAVLNQSGDPGQVLSAAGCVGPRGLSMQSPLARYLERKTKRRSQVKKAGQWWCWIWSGPPDPYVVATEPLPEDLAAWADSFEGGDHDYLVTYAPAVVTPWGEQNAVFDLGEGSGLYWVRAEGDSGVACSTATGHKTFSLDCLRHARATAGWYAWGEGRWMIPPAELHGAGQLERVLMLADIDRDALIQPARSLATILNAYPRGRIYLKAVKSVLLFKPDAIVSFYGPDRGTVRIVTAEAGEHEVSLTSLAGQARADVWPIELSALEVIPPT